ncbi:MAG: tRNA preQ1(34) S-adenosylmethionine ribosyltransferase-isomerase QueA [Desulfamplus sp.]|nr:tRNA preQ1(34) S-adenosylmethionine ribosyltransferase-isomerase QueA [Desulfamplus sp.]
MYSLSDYEYDLPQALIAQHPMKTRDESRLMVVKKNSTAISHLLFREIESLLRPGDLLVINNTRVVRARLRGFKASGGRVEVLIADYAGGIAMERETGFFQCDCMIRASRGPRPGTVLFLGKESEGCNPGNAGKETEGCSPGNSVKAVVERVSGTLFNLRFHYEGDFSSWLEENGEIPLPPYITGTTPGSKISLERKDESASQLFGSAIVSSRVSSRASETPSGREEDAVDYQTVYASQEGAVAAPTAGLHFTETLMERLGCLGINFAEITLHVGYGTFSPVRVDDIRRHRIHSEFFVISRACADAVNLAKSRGNRVVAVGTTSVRTLEYAAGASGHIEPGQGMCDLFIYPGYPFKVVDAMITNFHLPHSTLLMLVSAFAGRDMILRAYEEAVKKGYRFFSYGDAMFLA